MRCDQFMGLPPSANAYLYTQNFCPSVTDFYSGMFGDKYSLHKYTMLEGYAVEFVQADPWASGPVFFLGLIVYDNYGTEIQRFEWTDKEIEDNL